jgi:HEAT repeat protein
VSARPRPAPPSGQPPPIRAEMADGTVLDLAALAAEVCARYAAEYPDEHERYGEAGRLWCLHDNQHLLNWAVLDTLGYVVMDEQVAWLAKILEAREFPLDRLARDLDIAAVVVGERVPRGDAVAAALTGAAAMVRSRSTFL